jgi:hypothetical protein
MLRLITAVALFNLAGPLNAATLSVSGPATGLTQVIVDQPYSQFSKVGLTGGALQTWGFNEFWTDAPQVWITDNAGIGSLHTLVLAPQVSLIAVRPTYVPEGSVQEFAYEYLIGGLRQQLGPIYLSYGAASFGAVPEPTTALLSLMGVGVLWAARRRSVGSHADSRREGCHPHRTGSELSK